MIRSHEIVFASSEPNVSRAISARVKAGELHRLLSRAYTTKPIAEHRAVVARHLYQLIGHLYPGSMLAYRSGLEFVPTSEGRLYVHGKPRRPVRWPGVTLYFSEGEAALPDDRALGKGLRAPSLERALLENLLPIRALAGERRVCTPELLEKRLISVLDAQGEAGLNVIRDRAQEVATQLVWLPAFARLNKLISALLTTGSARGLVSEAGRARALGLPYDSARLDLFRTLQRTLLQTSLPTYPARTTTPSAYRNFAFFESYFSNFIEGTEFTVDEAERIVFHGEDIPTQEEDSHDVRAVYQLCSSRVELRNDATDATQFAEALRARHAVMLAQRPQKRPGRFKVRANRAGETEFVTPELVVGTLAKGFEILGGLHLPIQRALFLMFVISETHPFDDGNGRLARLVMNAELSQAGAAKILIPTVYREDYLLGLRALTRRGDAGAYIRMMRRVSGYSAALDPDDRASMRAQLQLSNAFALSSERAIVFPQGV